MRFARALSIQPASGGAVFVEDSLHFTVCGEIAFIGSLQPLFDIGNSLLLPSQRTAVLKRIPDNVLPTHAGACHERIYTGQKIGG